MGLLLFMSIPPLVVSYISSTDQHYPAIKRIKGDCYMMDWNVIYKELTSKHNYIKANPSATQKQVSDAENHWAVNYLMT